MKLCIACAEEIQNAAKLCKHCGTLQNDKAFSETVGSTGEVRPSEHQVVPTDEPVGALLCPRCSQSRQLQNVRAIRESQSSGTVGGGVGVSSSGVGGGIGYSRNSSDLAKRLLPPAPPSFGCLNAVIVGMVLGAILGIPIGLLIGGDAIEMSVIVATLIAIPIALVIGSGRSKRGDKWRSYEAGNKRLNAATYCWTCDLVFDAKDSSNPEEFLAKCFPR